MSLNDIDWGRSGRRDRYTYHLVDPWTLQEIGKTFEAELGVNTITYGIETDNFYCASIKALEDVPYNSLVRVKHEVEVDGVIENETLGTFFIDSCPKDAKFKKVSRDLSCYSTLWRVMDDKLINDFYRKKGSNVVEAIKYLATADKGLFRTGIGAATHRTFGADIWFELGSGKGETMQHIAGWVNNIVLPDGDGYLVCQEIPDPAKAEPKYIFEEGKNCSYLPGVSIDDTHDEAVNRVMAYFSRKTKPKTARKDANGKYVKDSNGKTIYDYDDPYPLSDKVVVDLPAHYPYSFESLGRRSTYVMKVSEACSHEDLTKQTEDYLYTHCGAVDYIEIEHVGIPTLRPYDTVVYRNSSDFETAVEFTCQIHEMAMTLGLGCMCKSKLKVIA